MGLIRMIEWRVVDLEVLIKHYKLSVCLSLQMGTYKGGKKEERCYIPRTVPRFMAAATMMWWLKNWVVCWRGGFNSIGLNPLSFHYGLILMRIYNHKRRTRKRLPQINLAQEQICTLFNVLHVLTLCGRQTFSFVTYNNPFNATEAIRNIFHQEQLWSGSTVSLLSSKRTQISPTSWSIWMSQQGTDIKMKLLGRSRAGAGCPRSLHTQQCISNEQEFSLPCLSVDIPFKCPFPAVPLGRRMT